MGKLKLAISLGDDVPLNPARDLLREAIAERDALAGTLAALEEALPKASDRFYAVRRTHGEAVTALATAKRDAAAYVVSQSIGEPGETPPSVEYVRRKLTEAEDDLETERGAGKAIEVRIAQTKNHLSYKQDAVKLHAVSVLAQCPAVARAKDELEAAQRTLIDKAVALNWMVSNGVIHKEMKGSPLGFDQDTIRAISLQTRFQVPPLTWKGLMDDPSLRGDVPFAAALAALMRDADAELPA